MMARVVCRNVLENCYDVKNIFSACKVGCTKPFIIRRTVLYMQYQNVCRNCTHSYRNVNVPLFCVGEYRLRLLENWMMKKVFGLKSDEVTEEWRRLHMEELYVQYTFPNNVRVIKSERMKRTEHVTCMAERRAAYRFGVGKPGGERLRGKPRRRLKYNIKTDFQGLPSRVMEWIDLAQDRDSWRALVNTMNEPSVFIKCGKFLD